MTGLARCIAEFPLSLKGGRRRAGSEVDEEKWSKSNEIRIGRTRRLSES
jgi:hypothetical protein